MKIIAFIEDYKVVKKILDHLGICEFDKKRAPPKVAEDPAGFDEYIIDDYIDSDNMCLGFCWVVLYEPAAIYGLI